MRLAVCLLSALVTFYAFPASAQEWIEYVNEEEMFGINLPGEPAVDDATYISEYRAELPAKVFTATDGRSNYKVTVVNFAPTSIEGERALWDFYGAVATAATRIRARGGQILQDGWAQVDRIPGHQLTILNDDQTQTWYQIHTHGTRLYIGEATSPVGATPPINFQQSLYILDEEGEIVRYDRDLRTRIDAER
jgi:hypothetical protein